jgi:hypothetical protein
MEAKHWTMLTVYYIVLQCDNTQHSMGPHPIAVEAKAAGVAKTSRLEVAAQEVEARRNGPSGRRCEAPPVPMIEGAGGRAGDEAGGEAQRGCVV